MVIATLITSLLVFVFSMFLFLVELYSAGTAGVVLSLILLVVAILIKKFKVETGEDNFTDIQENEKSNLAEDSISLSKTEPSTPVVNEYLERRKEGGFNNPGGLKGGNSYNKPKFKSDSAASVAPTTTEKGVETNNKKTKNSSASNSSNQSIVATSAIVATIVATSTSSNCDNSSSSSDSGGGCD